MGRATTKTDLIKSANEQFEKLWKLTSSMTEFTFNFGDNPGMKEAHWQRDKNLRDVFIHLYEWHKLLLSWVKSNQNGESKPFLPEPYNWKTYGEMNIEFWKKHQSTTREASEKMLRDSHKQVMEMIDRFTNEALFEKKHFNWTGTSSLGAYCVSATSSHYDWAIKKIKTHIKATAKPL